MEVVPRIAVLTSGGDAPGMNAVIRAVVRTAISEGAEAFGVEHGFDGLLQGRFREFRIGDVGGVLDRGGTFLGTSRSARFMTPEGVAEGARVLKDRGITGLVAVGGEGTFRGADELGKLGIATVGVPATIDNDVSGTDTCIGFDTALNTICDAVSKVRDTASSHERTFVIEVMGRECGMIALYAGLAGGADCILVPEVPWDLTDVCAVVQQGTARGKKHSIIMVAEGAGHAFGIATDLERMCGHEVRAVILGHVQRGGSPSAFDRNLASRMGAHAARVLLAGESAKVIGLRNAETVAYPIADAHVHEHRLHAEIYDLARTLAR